MSKHYMIGDCHYGHSNIHLKFRKEFSSQEEHNETIHQNIMNTGNKQDCLWLLGDIFFKESEFWRLSAYAKKFQHVYYILGNHCKPSVVRYAMQHKNISIMGVEQRWGLWLTHIPVMQQEMYRAKGCIAGHLHTKQVLTPSGELDERYFIVSCEQVNYTPVSLEYIRDVRGW